MIINFTLFYSNTVSDSTGNALRDSVMQCEIQTGNCNHHGYCKADLRGVGDYICRCYEGTGWTGNVCQTCAAGWSGTKCNIHPKGTKGLHHQYNNWKKYTLGPIHS